MHACLFEIGVKRDGRKAAEEGQQLGDGSVPFFLFIFLKLHGPCYAQLFFSRNFRSSPGYCCCACQVFHFHSAHTVWSLA